MIRVDVVHALIDKEDERKILLTRVRAGSIPGGAVEHRETLKQAVIRETKEESS